MNKFNASMDIFTFKSSLLTVLLITVLFFSCEEQDISEIPDCLQEKVADFQRNPLCDDSAISSYYFQKGVVYTFCSGICISDGGCGVYNERCELLGSLGTIAGLSKINGEEFSNAVLLEVLWVNN